MEYEAGADAPVFVKEGYDFVGWDKDFSYVTKYLEVTAIWKIKSYAVIFDGNGGTVVSGHEEQVVEYEAGADAPVFVKEGYDFVGWDKDFGCVTEYLEVTAIWEIKSYTVTFDGKGELLVNGQVEQTINYGSGAIAPLLLVLNLSAAL